jgi:hypothetical protein
MNVGWVELGPGQEPLAIRSASTDRAWELRIALFVAEGGLCRIIPSVTAAGPNWSKQLVPLAT